MKSVKKQWNSKYRSELSLGQKSVLVSPQDFFFLIFPKLDANIKSFASVLTL